MTKTANTVCVYGALRSGTTMLRLMLDSHPQLSCPGESDYIFGHLTIQNENWSLDTEALKRNWLFKTSGMTLVDGSARDQVCSLIQQAGQGRDWGVLVLHRELNKVLDAIPDLKIIHILRDPRDVARSSIGMGWAGNVYSGLGHWLETEDAWSAAAPRLAAGQYMEVRYEKLVASPEAELARICGFVGVPFDPAMLTYDQRTTYAKPDSALVSRWKGRLSPRDIGLLEARLGDRLQTRGYEPSGYPPIRLTQLNQLALKLDNKLGIWSRRIKDYGLVDPLTVSVANRLKMPALARRARGRMEQKIIDGLK
ncbi:sulfotransferase family protein [Tabrizicola sp.]|uniref:sulfotransferase family protein n=1 Tax=Tabrizicola sp. TaxID=2005166 RepID=UPI003F362D91